MDKFQKQIMVIDRSTLFQDGYFQGFLPAAEVDYYSTINQKYFYHQRGDAEERPDLKQPIAYCIIAHKESRKVFAYQRSSKTGEYSEKRLMGKWSWGIGGHIDKIDADGTDPIHSSMLREVEEEIHISHHDEPIVLGYINDDRSDVGQVHFGILFLLWTTDDGVRQNDKEIAWGGYKSLGELEAISTDRETEVETWSEIALEPLQQILNAH